MELGNLTSTTAESASPGANNALTTDDLKVLRNRFFAGRLASCQAFVLKITLSIVRVVDDFIFVLSLSFVWFDVHRLCPWTPPLAT